MHFFSKIIILYFELFYYKISKFLIQNVSNPEVFFFKKILSFFLNTKHNNYLNKILLVCIPGNFNNRIYNLNKSSILFELLIFIKFIYLFYISLDHIYYYNNLTSRYNINIIFYRLSYLSLLIKLR